jgi:hypothetical protein
MRANERRARGGRAGRITVYAAVCVAVLGIAGCEQSSAPVLPDPVEAGERYRETAELRGNLLEVRVEVPGDRMRGGGLWARSGPYFYLFSVATRDLFREYPDLAAVRVVTVTERGEEVARAMLTRGDLNEVTWRHALAYASRAQTEGTANPGHVAKLVREGEDAVTEYAYNPKYAGR